MSATMRIRAVSSRSVARSRRLLSREYGWPLSADNIALTAGSQAGFFFLFNLFAGRVRRRRVARILLPVTPEYVGYADVGLDGRVVQRAPARDRGADAPILQVSLDFDKLDDRRGHRRRLRVASDQSQPATY